MENQSTGTKLKWNGNDVGKLKNIGGVELSTNMIDTTTHQSADAFKEKIPGLIEAGDVAIEGLFDPADTNGQIAMLADANSRTKRAFSIVFPDTTGTSWGGNAYISKIKIGDTPVEGMIPFTATLSITGKPVLTVATSAGMSALAISNSAVVAPAFAIGTFDYVATVLNGVSSVTVTPTAGSHTITVIANGVSQTVTSGQASSAIALGAAGSITTIAISVAEANKAPKVYTIRVVRAA